MTTTVTTARNTLTANGTNPLPFTFQAISSTEIMVTRNGNVANPSTYTVALNPDGTGSVTPTSTWATDAIVIVSSPSYQQPTSLAQFGAWYPNLMNAPLDRLARSIIALRDSIGVAAPGEPGEDGTDAQNPNYSYAINTLTPGSSATIGAAGVYPNITLTFGIPRGDPGASGALGDGTYGGIVVSGTGTTLNVVAGHITLARMANLAANSFLGNNTGSAAVPLALTVAQAKALLALAKADVGLGNVDNTTDANKPVSTATQTALNLKANTASPILTGNPEAPTQAAGDASTKLATTAFVDRLRALSTRSIAGGSAAVGDRGGMIISTAGVTIPSATFAAGDVLLVYNNSASAFAITQGGGLTMRLHGSATTGSLTLAQRGEASVRFISASECVVNGDVT